jgi:hypothetical protein
MDRLLDFLCKVIPLSRAGLPSPPRESRSSHSSSNCYDTVRASSGLPMPVPKLPLKHLPFLLRFGTIHNCLREAFVLRSAVDSPLEPPRWEAWLDSWYRMIDGEIWPILEEDDEADRRGLAERISAREHLQAGDGSGGSELAQLAYEIGELEKRIVGRLERFFGAFFGFALPSSPAPALTSAQCSSSRRSQSLSLRAAREDWPPRRRHPQPPSFRALSSFLPSTMAQRFVLFPTLSAHPSQLSSLPFRSLAVRPSSFLPFAASHRPLAAAERRSRAIHGL